MKITKVFVAISMMALASTAFAAEGMIDKLYEASGYVVENNSFYLMNILDWQKLTFNKGYGLVTLSSENYGNLAVATKLKNGNSIHASWRGDLWEEDASNDFAALYGIKESNLAIGGFFGKKTTSYLGSPVTYSVKYAGASIGKTLDEKIAFAVNGTYVWDKDDFSVIDLGGEFVYTLGKGSSSDKQTEGKKRRI